MVKTISNFTSKQVKKNVIEVGFVGLLDSKWRIKTFIKENIDNEVDDGCGSVTSVLLFGLAYICCIVIGFFLFGILERRY